ncbi:Crossover junction endonuclease eme1b, partial [Thalictrum thalictroides]
MKIVACMGSLALHLCLDKASPPYATAKFIFKPVVSMGVMLRLPFSCMNLSELSLVSLAQTRTRQREKEREHALYKNQTNSGIWTRPPVEEALSKLTTDFARVHSRQCRDEAELADQVVGLTCALATCHFRKKLTRFSINANGTIVSKDSIDRNIIKKNV